MLGVVSHVSSMDHPSPSDSSKFVLFWQHKFGRSHARIIRLLLDKKCLDEKTVGSVELSVVRIVIMFLRWLPADWGHANDSREGCSITFVQAVRT